jgi:hypothetical protein
MRDVGGSIVSEGILRGGVFGCGMEWNGWCEVVGCGFVSVVAYFSQPGLLGEAVDRGIVDLRRK